MSRASHTPVPFWLQMPIRRLFAWIETINEVEKEEAEEQKQNSNNAQGGETAWQGHKRNLNCFLS